MSKRWVALLVTASLLVGVVLGILMAGTYEPPIRTQGAAFERLLQATADGQTFRMWIDARMRRACGDAVRIRYGSLEQRGLEYERPGHTRWDILVDVLSGKRLPSRCPGGAIVGGVWDNGDLAHLTPDTGSSSPRPQEGAPWLDEFLAGERP